MKMQFGCILLLLTASALAQRPLYEFTFNDAGSNFTQSSGEEPVQGELFDKSEKPASLFSEDRGGVSGQPGDYAFSNVDAAGMGVYPGGVLVVKNDWSRLEGAKSMTITGWYRTAEGVPLDNMATLINFASKDEAGGVILRAFRPETATLQVRVNGAQAIAPGVRNFSAINRWVFFAVTLDLTNASGDNVRLYQGSEDEASSVIASGNYAASQLHSEGQPLTLGAVTAMGHRPFHGWMDNVRIFLNSEDGGAALDQEAIEAIRNADLRNEALQSQ